MSKGRILVVDDLPDWRTTLSGIFLDEGYAVWAACNQQEAMALIQQKQIHLAVLDVRLDEADENNREGLELMRRIKAYDPTVLVIILTGFADVSMVQEALRPQQDGHSLAYSFVEKPNSEELVEEVEKAFTSELKINRDLEIQTQKEFFNALPSRLRVTHLADVTPEQLQIELDELLRKLFYNCTRIKLSPMQQGYSGAVVFGVEPHYQDRGQGEEVVAKIGEWPLIEEEEHRFKQAGQGIVGGHRLPQQLKMARTRSLGGLIYSFAGLGKSTGFVDFYNAATSPKIKGVLQNLFLETCFPWGRAHKVTESNFNFTTYYSANLHLQASKLRHAYDNLFGKRHVLKKAGAHFRFLDQKLINPVEYIVNHPLIGPANLTSVHGDLTGYNVIIDHRNETWLIDFARTGQGLFLQDFASFENFIKFSMLASDDLETFFEWEKALSKTDALQPPAKLARMQVPSSLGKAHQTILNIRRLAYQLSDDQYLTEYLIGLLFHALKLITIMKLEPIQRDLALVSAALICERLQNNNPSP